MSSFLELLLLVCCDFTFICFKKPFNFPFDFFFDLLVIQESVNFQELMNAPVLLLMISSFMPLWSERIPGMIPTLLNLLRLLLWPNGALS